MSESKHTPWVAQYIGLTTWVVKAHAGMIELVKFDTKDREWNEAHAKQVVREHNSHDKLVAACEATLTFLSQSSKLDWDGNLTEQLEAALTAAKETPC